MAEGARRIAELADEIDTACSNYYSSSNSSNGNSGGRNRGEDVLVGNRRIKMIDIGGGLSVNYYGDSVSPTFEEYSTALLSVAPKLFQYPDRLVCTGKTFSCTKAMLLPGNKVIMD